MTLEWFLLVSVCRIVVLAGDTLPIDVYCHLPIMCEDRNLPYAYIPSKVVSVHPSMVECLKTELGFLFN